MQKDTKPKKDDIQDDERKTPFSRSEYHGVITSYAGLALSLIAIILSVITMYQSHMMETREIVQILRAEDDGYYHFDGETLFKKFQVTVANNSAIPVSVVEITIERGDETRTFRISDFPDNSQLNIDANFSRLITIPWSIDTSEENAQVIREYMGETESDIVLSSRFPEIGTSVIGTPSDESKSGDALEQARQWLIDNPKKGEAERVDIKDVFLWMWRQAKPLQEKQKVLTLSITLHTAKNNQFVLTTEDMGPPEFKPDESKWVVERLLDTESYSAALWAYEQNLLEE
ncbi:MAG: hypothetical protein IJQ81_16225 [Oscillibacter sp.]|nr:hypothetical protein [Oscillibacter sp.]